MDNNSPLVIETMTKTMIKIVQLMHMVLMLQVDGGIGIALLSTSTTTMQDLMELFTLVKNTIIHHLQK